MTGSAMTGSVTSQDVDVLDVVKVVFVAFAPPAISFFGAAAGAYAVDSLIHATTPQETLDRLATLNIIWLLIPTLQATVASSAMRLSIYSKRAMRLAPWLLATGFAASLISIPFYDPFLNAFREGWREMTAFATFMPMILTYIIAANRLIVD
jgi:hypothetical protein